MNEYNVLENYIPYNLTILDFKFESTLKLEQAKSTYNLSILDFKSSVLHDNGMARPAL